MSSSTPSWAPTAHPLRADRAPLVTPGTGRTRSGVIGIRSRLVHLVCVLAITLSAGATAFVPETRANAQGSGDSRVATTDLNLRAQPTTSSAVLMVIPSGRSVSVTGGNQNGFLPVTYSGVNGFAYADFLGTGSSTGDAPGDESSGTTGGTNVLVSLNLRADASTSSQILAVMPAGATVTLLGEQRNGFVRVSYNGTQGWASGQFLGSGGGAAPDDSGTDGGTSSGATGSARSTTDLNLRSGAGTSFAVIAVIPAGGQVQLTGTRQNNFAQLTYNGTQGWASLDFLTTGGGTVPPSVPDETDPGAENGASGSATVNGSLNLRASASTSAQIIAVMPGGAQVQVLGPRQNGFAQVTYNGSQGWAFEQFLTIGGTAPAPSASNQPAPTTPTTPPSSGSAPSGPLWATVSLNLRSGPGTTYSVLTVMPAGSSGTSTGQSQNGFWSLNYNGVNGWASSSLLSTDGGSAVQPPPTSPGNSGSYTQDQIIQIIYAAADRYGQPRADMLRVARCESVLDPNAVNAPGGSYGLFQFLPSTWATTPYAGDNIFDPYASANAAGWMWQQGRRNEWVCQ